VQRVLHPLDVFKLCSSGSNLLFKFSLPSSAVQALLLKLCSSNSALQALQALLFKLFKLSTRKQAVIRA
jgi:hypothetical protein